MIYMMLVALAFSLLILLRKYACRYTWFFAGMGLSLALTVLSSVIYAAKQGNYYYPNNLFFFPDYQIFLSLSQLRINYYSAVRICNIGIAAYLLFSLLFAYQFTRNSRRTLFSKNLPLLLLLSCFPVYYVWFYDPNTSYSFYIWYISGKNAGVARFIIAVDLVNYIILLLYLVAPILILILMYRQITIDLKKRQTFSLIVCLFLLNLFFLIMSVWGPFKQIYLLSFPMGLLYFPQHFEFGFLSYEILPLVLIGTVQVILFILFRYKGLDTVDFFREFRLKRNVHGLNQNLRSIFHSFKNTLFTIRILADQAEMGRGTEQGEQAVRRIREIADESMDSMTRMLDSFREIRLQVSRCNLVDVLEAAVERVQIPENITLIRQYSQESVESVMDEYYITEAIVNLLQNACDAVMKARRERGQIKLEVFAEHEWAVLRITDNGVGIPKKNTNQIFKPFYTTESTRRNWGIGLSYVFRVVKAHLGFITVNSKEGEFTAFQVLLYRAEG